MQDQRFHRVGGEKDIEVDVRIIAASNSDLKPMQEKGTFRADLFYRLSVFPLEIPPLRERREDLPRLVEQKLELLNRRYRRSIGCLDPAVEQAFLSYGWPGNIRELENILERAVILESTDRISPRSIPLEMLRGAGTHIVVPVAGAPPGTLAEARSAAVAGAERRYLEKVLAAHDGRIDASAQTAGMTTRQLRKLLARHEIDKAEFKPSGGPGSSAFAPER